MKQPPGVVLQNNYSEKFKKTFKKTPAMESFLFKKKTLLMVFSCEFSFVCLWDLSLQRQLEPPTERCNAGNFAGVCGFLQNI